MQTNIIAILLPGTTGTTLMDGSNVAWGRNGEVSTDASAGNDAAAEAVLESPSLTIGTLDGWNSQKLYGVFQSQFQNDYGFATALITPGSALPALGGRQLFGFAYDWRRENTVTAGQLQSLLEQIDAAFSSKSESYETWLIGHSMGGLVARAVLEPNAGSEAGWYTNIQGLITLGTPHLGAPMALQGILNQLPKFLAPDLEPVMVSFINYTGANGAFDSTYELLPPPQVQFITEQPSGTKASVFDLQSEIVSAGGAQVNFTDAEAFFTKVLTYTATPKPYYCAFGIGLLTTCGYTFDAGTNTWQSEATGPLGLTGDFIVPDGSAQFAGSNVAARQSFIGINHIALVSDKNVITQVGTWMGLA